MMEKSILDEICAIQKKLDLEALEKALRKAAMDLSHCHTKEQFNFVCQQHGRALIAMVISEKIMAEPHEYERTQKLFANYFQKAIINNKSIRYACIASDAWMHAPLHVGRYYRIIQGIILR